MSPSSIQEQKSKAASHFKALQGKICDIFEAIEQEKGSKARFEEKKWQREGGGGGQMRVMHGAMFEKVGVNFSEVWGEFSSEFAKKIPGAGEDPSFYATGISLVAHMCSPHVPAVHMNTRFISTQKSWFGGGADLTPMLENKKDAADFHAAFKACCDQFDKGYYPEFKDWCDRYFYLPHRKEPRGIGGIFYDQLNRKGFEDDFAFTKAVGECFADIYPQLVRRHMDKTWTKEERAKQLAKRGRYVEFNLLYDRGTKFGLETGGNTEAILMSLPPLATW